MKFALVVTIWLFPAFLSAQRTVTLSVKQPPVMQISQTRSDTTILAGKSIMLGTDIRITGGSGTYTYRWFPTTGLSNPYDPNPVAAPPDTTTYILTVTDLNGCSESASFTVNARAPLVGLNETALQAELTITLFPNPNNGQFRVNIQGPPSPQVELSFINSSGKEILRQIVHNFQGNHEVFIPLKQPAGLYNLKAETLSGSFRYPFIIR